MTRLENAFDKAWEELHKGKQLTLAKREEMRRIAREWFLRGTDYLANEISKYFEKEMQKKSFGNMDFCFREKEVEPPRDKCKDCSYWKAEKKLCTKYNMISEAWKTCKSCKEKCK